MVKIRSLNFFAICSFFFNLLIPLCLTVNIACRRVIPRIKRTVDIYRWIKGPIHQEESIITVEAHFLYPSFCYSIMTPLLLLLLLLHSWESFTSYKVYTAIFFVETSEALRECIDIHGSHFILCVNVEIRRTHYTYFLRLSNITDGPGRVAVFNVMLSCQILCICY